MSPLETAAKAVAKANWHNDPDRPFTDEVWERELKWWREAEPEFLKENMYAAKCFDAARSVILALSEMELPEGIVSSFVHARVNVDGQPECSVGCVLDAPDDDPGMYAVCGLPWPSDNPIVRSNEEFDFKCHVIRCGFRSMARAIAGEKG